MLVPLGKHFFLEQKAFVCVSNLKIEYISISSLSISKIIKNEENETFRFNRRTSKRERSSN